MLKGTLDDFSLQDVFRLAAWAARSGKLEVQRRAGSGRVFFRDGEIYYAESSVSREPLGQKLIWAGAVTQPQLQKALEENVKTGQRVGDILLETGAVTLRQIEMAVRSQMEDAIFDLLRWDFGEFEWEPGAEIDAEINITADVEELIYEASRRIEELAAIKQRIPSPNVVMAMAERPPAGADQIAITGEAWRVLVLVDGHRSVADIAALVGADTFKTTRTLFKLLEEGLIETRGLAEPSDEEEMANEVPVDQAFTTDAPEKWFESSEADAGHGEESHSEAVDPLDALSESVDLASVVSEIADVDIDGAEVAPEPPSDDGAPPAPQPEAEVTLDPEPEEREAPPPRPEEAPAPFGGPDDLRVDRAAVVRELAGLFNDDFKPRPRAVPSPPPAAKTPSEPDVEPGPGVSLDEQDGRPEPELALAGRSVNGSPSANGKKRVEDNADVTRALISKMIDGVKGM